jgi:hypothetical protein
MNKVKTDIPNLQKLQAKLHDIMESGLVDFIKTTHARRIAVRASFRFVVVSVLFILATGAFLFLASIDLNSFFGKVIAMILLLWSTVLLVSGKSWFIGSALLAREINMALVPILANTFDRTLLYTYNENAVDSVTELLGDSALLEDEIENLQVKSVYTVFSNFDMRVHEISFNQKPDKIGGRGLKSHAKFIDVNMSTEYPAKTILSSAGNRFGFSQKILLQHIQNNQSFHSIEQSEENLKVFSTKKAEAENFLTQELLQIMRDWERDVKVNLRMMRKGTKLYILVPASQENNNYSSTSTEQEAIERYAQVTARPIWRALILAEEVNV